MQILSKKHYVILIWGKIDFKAEKGSLYKDKSFNSQGRYNFQFYVLIWPQYTKYELTVAEENWQIHNYSG